MKSHNFYDSKIDGIRVFAVKTFFLLFAVTRLQKVVSLSVMYNMNTTETEI